LSIRLRLAFWYSAVLGVTLVVFSLLLYLLMERHLIDEGDAAIASRAQHIAGTIRVDSDAPALRRVELPPMDIFESPGVYVQVAQTDGAIVARSDNLAGQQLPLDDQAFATASNGQGVFYTAQVRSERVRIYVRPLTVNENVIGFVQVGRSYREAYTVLDRLRVILLGAGLVSLLLATATALGVAGGALKPIATITQTARAIALSKGFSRRLEHAGARDELGQLGATFNEMLASLEEAYSAQQRFIADASHELRAPLTAVEANLELLERKGANLPEEERLALAMAARGEAKRMTRLVADLLALARADAGQKVRMQRVELDRLLLEVYRDTKVLAKGIRLTVEEIDQVPLIADPDRLKQLILILVENALRYTPAGGEVALFLRKESGTATLQVADTGVGIATEDLPHIFERFYRADKARARDSAGTGLGLAIARWIVEEHGGEIAVESTTGHGSIFTVRLPLAPSPATVAT